MPTVFLTVTSLNDSGLGTLRDAIDTADNDPNHNYSLDLRGLSGTIDLLSSLRDLSNNLAIHGPGASSLTVQRDPGASAFGIFTVDSGFTVSLSGLTIANGSSGTGGGILNAGTLTITDCTIAHNTADSGAGIWQGIGAAPVLNGAALVLNHCTIIHNSVNRPDGEGGGIVNDFGTLRLNNCTLEDNSGGAEGGGIANHGELHLNQTLLVGNSAGAGGGIANDWGGTVTIANGSSLTGNSASRQGGGVFNSGADGPATVTIGHSELSANFANGFVDSAGGGIENIEGGTVAIQQDSILLSNTAPLGGGIDNDSASTVTIGNSTIADNQAAVGGGVHNAGMLTVTASTLHDNRAGLAGGGIENSGIATIRRSEISVNTAVGEFSPHGGGIRNESTGTMTIAGCTIQGNAASAAGGGIDNAGTLNLSGGSVDSNHASGDGGGIANTGTVTVTGGDLAFNIADSNGGAIDNSGTLTITRNSTLANNSATTGGGLANESGGMVTINGSSLASNSASFAGGGLFNAGNFTRFGTITITAGVLAKNSAKFGGGLFNSGTLTLARSTLVNNTAGLGGGILNTGYGTLSVTDSTLAVNLSSAEGGALLNEFKATLTNTTISGNVALSSGAGCSNNADSGGLTLVNCTVANNRATTGGGGIFNYPASILKIANSTIAGNVTTNPGTDGGGLDNLSGGVATLFDTIIATNTAPGAGPDVFGDVKSFGHNLVGNPGGGSGFFDSDLLNVNPLLAALGNYGGPTQTMTLLPGSPAIDAGDNTNAPPTDQRGFARILHGTIDIGAVEVRGFQIIISGGNNQSTPVNTAFPAPLVVTVTSAFGEPVQGGVVMFTAPNTGASTSPAVNTATIGSSGKASVSVIANAVAGSYTVFAGFRGVVTPSGFTLTNTAAPTLGGSLPADRADTPMTDLALYDAALAQWYGQDDTGSLPGIGGRKTKVSLNR